MFEKRSIDYENSQGQNIIIISCKEEGEEQKGLPGSKVEGSVSNPNASFFSR
jgi:hypothetical protein